MIEDVVAKTCLSAAIIRAALIEGVVARPGGVFNLLNITHGQISREVAKSNRKSRI